MASALATNRLRKELQKIQQDPPPGIIAEPIESDILVWFYAIRGPDETPFEGGVYIGKLCFPRDYPMKAPDIYMLTPSGRYEINKKLCLSMSSFHNETWCPSWNVGSIIQGIQSFMASSELTTGGMQAPDAERRKLAENSMTYNQKNYPHLFGGSIDEAFTRADQARQEAEMKSLAAAKVRVSAKRTGTAKEVKEKDSQGTEPTLLTEDASTQKDKLVAVLTAQEIEKRRKKNAKKREKQKAKKAVPMNETSTT